MKTFVLSLLFVASLCGCSAQSSSSNLSQDIVGCWEDVDYYHIIESNFPEFDKHAQEKQKEELRNYPNTIAKFDGDKRYTFYKDTGEKSKIIRTYKIEGDSLYTEMVDAGGYRAIHTKTKIQIINDTLYTDVDVMSEIEWIFSYARVDKILTFPKDFEIKKAVRRVKSVRLKDCSQYQENQ